MHISFHQDPVSVLDLCEDLKDHGAVFWHTMRPNFREHEHLVATQGLEVISLNATLDGEFMPFLVRLDLAQSGHTALTERVAKAIQRWHRIGKPVPHLERI